MELPIETRSHATVFLIPRLPTYPSVRGRKKFKEWYLQLLTAEEHLLALREWRMRQSKMVSSLGQIIGHFGGEQYTEVDHISLELLQNA